MRKRSSCLAVVVGLLLSSAASIASAAPADGDSKTGSGVKQVAQADTPATPTQAADPTPQQQTEQTAPTPAVSVGGTLAPTNDAPATSSEGEQGKKKPRPWANSSIYATTSMTTATVFKGQQQYNNPTVDSSIYFLPRYSINDAFQIRGRLIFSYEYTNSDATVTNNEPRFSDTTLQLFYRKIPEFLTIKPQVYIQASAPTSPESRARTMIFSPGAGFNLSKSFEKVLGGDIQIVGLMGYSHPVYSSRQAEVRGSRPYSLQCGGSGDCQDLLTGTLNTSDSLSYALNLNATWGKFSPAIYYLGATQWVYHPSDANVQIAPGQEVAVGSSSQQQSGRSSVRQIHYFSAWLDYELNSWLTPEVGYFQSSSALNESGSYVNPFFDRYQDVRVYLGANINVDALVEQITTNKKAEPGIIRTKNSHTPIMRF